MFLLVQSLLSLFRTFLSCKNVCSDDKDLKERTLMH